MLSRLDNLLKDISDEIHKEEKELALDNKVKKVANLLILERMKKRYG